MEKARYKFLIIITINYWLYTAAHVSINSNFYKSPSNKLYLQSLQPNKSILIHIAPVYVLGNILTYCAANGGANQWTTMVLLSLFPVKCWVVDQEQSKWRYTNNFIYRRPHSVWYIPKSAEGERSCSFSSFPSPLALPSFTLLVTGDESA